MQVNRFIMLYYVGCKKYTPVAWIEFWFRAVTVWLTDWLHDLLSYAKDKMQVFALLGSGRLHIIRVSAILRCVLAVFGSVLRD